jgi:hypothetical protein
VVGLEAQGMLAIPSVAAIKQAFRFEIDEEVRVSEIETEMIVCSFGSLLEIDRNLLCSGGLGC